MAPSLRLGCALKHGKANMAALKIGIAAALAAFGVAAASGPAFAQDAPTPITVQLTDYRYTPAEIDLTHGQSYVLHLVNPHGGAHDLSAKAFFQTVTLAPASAAVVHDGDIEVKGGQSADVAFTAGAAGTYEMHCTHPMHSMFGMKGKIVVQ
jgi:plastocyanin